MEGAGWLSGDSAPPASSLSTPTPFITAPRSVSCSSISLPAGSALTLSNGQTITLAEGTAFQPICGDPISRPAIISNGGGVNIDEAAADDDDPTDSLVNLPTQDPFYASTFPQCYALAATTVVAYTLVIMLFITPRSFLDGGVVVLGRRGFTNGGAGGTNIGGRPWLQKIAAFTVAISLTIASSNTFRVAEDQYAKGFQNAEDLQSEVLGGTELKVIRIISDTFLWLAQAQTLIRLFPRQREKVIIKYTAFALITLDLIFQCLNSFQYTGQGNTRPKSFTEAVPALSYLFQLSLGVLYAAWVIYYSLMKKKYAFYHPQMKNMCLVSILSLLAILVPVVFFVLDICKPDFTGWGDYVRWVGAAAASVIVWEWVERIEALEREEKKDGILGREVFDGDEMLEVTQSDFYWPRRRRRKGKGDGSDADSGEVGSGRPSGQESPPPGGRGGSGGRGNVWPTVSSIATRYRPRSRSRTADQPPEAPRRTESTNNDRIRFLQPPLWPARPAPTVTPVSRTDTPSAASTVYAVRYHPLTETTSRSTPPPQGRPPPSRRNSSASSQHSNGGSTNSAEPAAGTGAAVRRDPSASGRWRALAQGLPFRRPGAGEEPEETARDENQGGRIPHEEGNRWDIRARLEEFAVTQAEKLRERVRPTVDTDSLPVTVIPAPPRRGAALAQLLEEEQAAQSDQQQGAARDNSSGSRASPTDDDEPLPSHLRRINTGFAPTPRPRAQTTTASRDPAGTTRSPPPISVVPAPTRGSHPPGPTSQPRPGGHESPDTGRRE